MSIKGTTGTQGTASPKTAFQINPQSGISFALGTTPELESISKLGVAKRIIESHKLTTATQGTASPKTAVHINPSSEISVALGTSFEELEHISNLRVATKILNPFKGKTESPSATQGTARLKTAVYINPSSGTQPSSILQIDECCLPKSPHLAATQKTSNAPSLQTFPVTKQSSTQTKYQTSKSAPDIGFFEYEKQSEELAKMLERNYNPFNVSEDSNPFYSNRRKPEEERTKIQYDNKTDSELAVGSIVDNKNDQLRTQTGRPPEAGNRALSPIFPSIVKKPKDEPTSGLAYSVDDFVKMGWDGLQIATQQYIGHHTRFGDVKIVTHIARDKDGNRVASCMETAFEYLEKESWTEAAYRHVYNMMKNGQFLYTSLGGSLGFSGTR